MFVNFLFHLVLLYHIRVFYVSFSVIISGSCVLFHLVLLYQVRVFYVSFSVIISGSCVLCFI